MLCFQNAVRIISCAKKGEGSLSEFKMMGMLQEAQQKLAAVVDLSSGATQMQSSNVRVLTEGSCLREMFDPKSAVQGYFLPINEAVCSSRDEVAFTLEVDSCVILTNMGNCCRLVAATLSTDDHDQKKMLHALEKARQVLLLSYRAMSSLQGCFAPTTRNGILAVFASLHGMLQVAYCSYDLDDATFSQEHIENAFHIVSGWQVGGLWGQPQLAAAA